MAWNEFKGWRWMTEGAVIVVSILLAFAIDAWWDERGEGLTEDRAIEQFMTELALYEQLVEQARARTEQASAATETLLTLVHEGEPVDAGHVSEALTQLGYRFYLADAMQAWHQLAAAGALRELSSPELRKHVANVANLLGVLDRMESLESDFIEDQLAPWLREHVDLFALRDGNPESRFTWEPDELLGRRDFSNLLVQRRGYLGRVRHFREEIAEELRLVRTAIDAAQEP